jgi:hypothetical protein
MKAKVGYAETTATREFKVEAVKLGRLTVSNHAAGVS